MGVHVERMVSRALKTAITVPKCIYANVIMHWQMLQGITMIKVGLLGYGKAGKAVARVINADPRFDLRWIAKRSTSAETPMDETGKIPLIGLESFDFSKWLDAHPVDAIQERCITLVSAISSCSPE